MQAEELSYVIVTPYSMRKSRTGGIVSRLISRTGLDLVGGRMFAPGEELVRRYTEDDRLRDRPAASRHPGVDSRLCPEEFHRRTRRPAPARAAPGFSRPGRDREDPPRRRPHRARADQRRDDSRHLRRLRHGRIGQGDLLRAGRARLARRRIGRGKSEALGGIFRQRRRHSRRCHYLSRRGESREIARPDQARQFQISQYPARAA